MTIDIVMPFYGRFDHFVIAVESVLTQSDPNWRLVIIDDAYPDPAPGEWAVAIADDRVTYVRNEVNLRPSRNYNKGVGLARSEFVVIMGCDDVMLPGFVARARELVAKFPEAAVIQPGVSVIDESGSPSRPLADRVKALYRFRGRGSRSLGGERLAVSLLRGNWTYFPSLIWRTEHLLRIKFRIDLDVVQDLAMLFEIVRTEGKLVLDDKVVFNYRRHSTSASAVSGPDGSRFRQEGTLYREAARLSDELGWHKAARAARRHLSSRLNALTELPKAIGTRNKTNMTTLVRHILGLTHRAD